MLPSFLHLPSLSNSPTAFLHKPHFKALVFRHGSKSYTCFTYPPSNQNPISGEESRWLREEQRWLREEQRWLREESRWNSERQALLQEISSLKLRIQELRRLNSVQGGTSASDTIANIAKLLQVLKEGDSGKIVNRIAEGGESTVPLVFETTKKEEEVVIKEVISIPDKKEIAKTRVTLRKGSEGDQVRDMQEALMKLGFYSGEEDIEFSSFSSGTERAVKTWQATIGATEDGIMTSELLETLFGTSGSGMNRTSNHKAGDADKGVNGAPVTSITNTSEVQEVQKTVVTDEGINEFKVSEHRVFLLGENRWEEPSRLSGECDGTGEPNIEEQFLEWVDEGAKCPYCEGLGYTTCDICVGNNK
ncbi:plastid transcriptionally active 5 [Striga asiatica]|uniref:Plastid transcriptionally active 5 n=1 Tax=Striga asiatica TaxID=4170 RepID=A0A5A7R8H4_STRAF|nr:plastid transcriptionally active 5 [Striga asiatica]